MVNTINKINNGILIKVCAWCKFDEPKTLPNDYKIDLPVTHGICAKCKAQIVTE